MNNDVENPVLKKLRLSEREARKDYWGSRLYSQLDYAVNYCRYRQDEQLSEAIQQAAAIVDERISSDRTVTPEVVREVEETLSSFTDRFKALHLQFVGHAHIDINWMWPWQETVAVTVETMRTLLNLMDLYPDFTFAQSQAIVYRILERYAPELLDRVLERIRDGRWEVTAAQWVESDMNIPNGESMIRQITEARDYLVSLLGIPGENLDLVFLPDTFGHAASLPNLLPHAGIKYYYHGRGSEDGHIYRWKGKGGSSLIGYREPLWYNHSISADSIGHVPFFVERYGISVASILFGVGDHGGGPTIRDLERLRDLANWPVAPTITYGTHRGYFQYLESNARLPEFSGERNVIFTGCYTSQARIKQANRRAEGRLYDAEVLEVISESDHNPALKESWRRVLTNQFHDILPGSGVAETREYALGQYQEVFAVTSTTISRTLRRLAEKHCHYGTGVAPADDFSSGAGVGYAAAAGGGSQNACSGGDERSFLITNTLPFPRKEVVEIIAWDWTGTSEEIAFQDVSGNTLPHSVVEISRDPYWTHDYVKAKVLLELPAGGSRIVRLVRAFPSNIRRRFHSYGVDDWLVERERVFQLENDRLSVHFDARTMTINGLYDKQTQTELIGTGKSAGPIVVQEEAHHMSSWVTGRYVSEKAADATKIIDFQRSPDGVSQWLTVEYRFDDSIVRLRYELNRDDSMVRVIADIQWRHLGEKGRYIPQLLFRVPLSYSVGKYRYDNPASTIDRPPVDQDRPANSFAAALRADDSAKPDKPGEPDKPDETDETDEPIVQLLGEGQHGFRGVGDEITMSLIRSSVDPDPTPEYGDHHLSFAVAVCDTSRSGSLVRTSRRFSHAPIVLSLKNGTWRVQDAPGGMAPGSPSLPPDSFSLVSVDQDNVDVTAITRSGNGRGLVVRLSELDGSEGMVTIRFRRPVRRAVRVDAHETELPETGAVSVEGTTVSFRPAAYEVVSVLVEPLELNE